MCVKCFQGLKQWVSVYGASGSPSGLVKAEVAEPILVPASGNLGRGLRFDIYGKFPGDVDETGLEATLWDALYQ